MKLQQYFTISLFVIIIVIFFSPFFISGRLPVPSDTIIGLYHPYRDLYAKDYPRGIPYKNFLITDPVRQQYPWKWLVIDQLKKFQLPVWNPYSFAGAPLVGTFQSGTFYPLNILFFVLPFAYAWGLLVVLQPLLAGIFLYLYLKYRKLDPLACLLASISFAFSGFTIAWLEWNTIVHTALWLPLILLAKEHLLKKMSLKWISLLIFAEAAQFFAGHIQIWFYSFIISNIYLWLRVYQIAKIGDKGSLMVAKKYFRVYSPFVLIGLVLLIITSVQSIPTIQFIMHSARDVDVIWQKEGWFIPWKHLVQFVAPDFFGNPTTLNYWSIWNYGEFIGYIGVFPLIMAIYALCFRRDKKTWFFGGLFILSLVFALPTYFAKLPFLLGIPFLSTAQPTRLLFVTDFSLAVPAGLGFDYFLRKKNKVLYPILSITLLFGMLWICVLWLGQTMQIRPEDLDVAKRNLYFPTVMLGVVGSVLVIHKWIPKKYLMFLTLFLLVVTSADLLRFANKFTPFTSRQYLFPSTKALTYLQKNIENYRFMTTDQRILPPNFNVYYKLQSVNGYDPLYLRRYSELIAASERGKPDISPPFGFNRIITPQQYGSKIVDLLGVKYVLSLTDITSPKLRKVFQEGETQIYENTQVLPRAFFVESIEKVDNKQQAINMLFSSTFNPIKQAVVDGKKTGGEATPPFRWRIGEVGIVSYTETEVVMRTQNTEDGFLVLTDSYYPTWHAKVDDKETVIYRTDYALRGIVVPKGEHIVTFYNTLF